MAWDDTRRTLSLQLAPASRLLPPGPRAITIQLADTTHSVNFEGKPVQVRF
jgi:hypothetical protein